MKKIDFHNIDIHKIVDTGAKKKFSFTIWYNKWKKQYKKKQEEQKEKLQARLNSWKKFVASYDRFDKYIFFTYIFLIFVLYFTFAYTYPMFKKMFKVQSSIVTAQENIETLKQNLESLQKADKKIEKIRSDITKIDKMAPDQPIEEDVVVILGSLLAKNFLASPERFSWNKEKGTTIETAEIYENFDVYSYTFATSGSFDNVKNFITDLRRNLRIIDIKDIKMIPLANGDIEFSAMVWVYNKKRNNGATEQRNNGITEQRNNNVASMLEQGTTRAPTKGPCVSLLRCNVAPLFRLI